MYFYSYIAVAVFVLMNLVTAILVENAVTNAKHDEESMLKSREKSKERELKKLKNLFTLMDADGSGTLSWDEFQEAFSDPDMSNKWKMLNFDREQCHEIFGLLDDGDGEIETQEFFEGLAKMKGSAQSKDVFRLQKTIDSVANTLREYLRLPSSHHPSPSNHGHHTGHMKETSRSQDAEFEMVNKGGEPSSLVNIIKKHWKEAVGANGTCPGTHLYIAEVSEAMPLRKFDAHTLDKEIHDEEEQLGKPMSGANHTDDDEEDERMRREESTPKIPSSFPDWPDFFPAGSSDWVHPRNFNSSSSAIHKL
jgi:Ca2+-binding EF-hand superfamily protein